MPPSAINTRRLQGIAADVELKNGVCQDITIGQVVVTTEVKGNAINVNVAVDNIQIFCSGSLKFGLAGINGGLDFEAHLSVPTTDVDVLLVSNDLNKEFPSSGCVVSCSAPVEVDSFVLDDVFVEGIPDKMVDEVVEAITPPVIEAIEMLGGEGKLHPELFDIASVSIVYSMTHY